MSYWFDSCTPLTVVGSREHAASFRSFLRGRNMVAASSPLRGILVDAADDDGRCTMDHAATMRRLYELISAGDIDGFGEFVADDFVEHEEALPGMEQNKDGVKQLFHVLRAAFPDLRMEPEDVLVSGDKVTARVSATGTHRGEFMGMPASGRSIDVQLIDIIRFGDDGLAREHWGIFDQMKMMQQLGAVPPPDAPPA